MRFLNKKIDVKTYQCPQVIYSWRPSSAGNNMFFSQTELTGDKKALFIINLKEQTFSVNSRFDKEAYGENWYEMLRTVCEIRKREDDEPHNLDTLEEGKLHILPVSNNEYAFKITEKPLVEI